MQGGQEGHGEEGRREKMVIRLQRLQQGLTGSGRVDRAWEQAALCLNTAFLTWQQKK